MIILLIAVIYLSFISLGIPDSLLGASWPIIQQDLELPLSFASYISIVISAGTIVSSLMCDKLIRKFSSYKVVVTSIFLTALSLFGFSISNNYILLLVFSIPYGLGAGAIDATLNNYVATHFKSKHMNWLHCMWGLGAILGTFILGLTLSANPDWHLGYFVISIIQIVIALIVLFSFPLWKRNIEHKNEENTPSYKYRDILKLKGIKSLLLSFFFYCCLEQVMFLWTSSYLVTIRNIDEVDAAKFAGIFYLGMILGRLVSGFISDKIGDKKLIRYGLFIIMVGTVLVFMPDKIVLIGILIVGIGCGPIYPSIIHQTPTLFGKDKSQIIIGLEMSFAYLGFLIVPPIFGWIADSFTLVFYPWSILLITVLIIICKEISSRNALK